AYSDTANMALIRSILALATVDSLYSVAPPNGNSFDLHDAEFVRETIVSILEGQKKKSHSTHPVYPHSLVERTSTMDDDEFEWRCDKAYENLQNSAFLKVVDKLQGGWPNEYFSPVHHSPDLKYFLNSVDAALHLCREKILAWDSNRSFTAYVRDIETRLNRIESRTFPARVFRINPAIDQG